ncbi:unnamed protein product [Auanema sp. JU1783]|nr:unnamed protein product [Auanema sp. JU1783]
MVGRAQYDFKKAREVFGYNDKPTKVKDDQEYSSKNPFVLFRYASFWDMTLYCIGTVAAIGSGLGFPVMSIIMGNITQEFMYVLAGEADMNNFSKEVEKDCAQFAMLGGAVYLCGIIQSIALVKACDNVVDNWRKRFFLSILRQDIAWYDKNHTGTLAPKLFDNLERTREGSGDKIGLMFQFLAQFVGGFVVALTHDWKLTLIMMSLSPLIMISGGYVATSMASAATIEAKVYSKAGGIVEEVLSSVTTVQAFNGQAFEIRRFDESLEKGRKLGIRKSFKVGIGIGTTFLFMFSSYALAFWIGVNYAAEGKLDGGTVMTVFFSVMMGSMALGQVGPQFAVIGTSIGAAASLLSIIERTPDIDSLSPSGKKPNDMKGYVKLENVFFSYPTRPDVPILRGISLEAQPGQTVALVGSSGCGKSTVTQLLLRYYNPVSGKVSIDNHDVSQLNIEHLRNYVGIVSQEPNLFNSTIEENIKYGKVDVSQAEIIQALKDANAYDFVMQFPNKLKTVVGDRGAQLSGGQKQRIAIARALVRNPKILLLDEATSALDAESEYIVQKALENASRGRTTIVIAHRLSTIRNADNIIAMKSGEIVEQGTHEELMDNKGLYFDLVSNQVFADLEKEDSDEKQAEDVEQIAKRRETIISLQEANVVNSVAEKDKVPTANLFRIINKSKPEWFYLALAFLSSTAQGCVFPAFSIIFVQLIQVFTKPPDQMKHDGHIYSLLFLALGTLMLFTMTLQTFFFGVAAENMTKRFRSMIFRNILRMDRSYFDKPINSPGKLTTRLAMDAPCLKSAIDFRLGMAYGAVVGLFVGVGIAFYYSWQMALLALAIAPLTIVGQSLQMQYTLGMMGGNTADMADGGKIAMEAIENIRTVHSLTLEKRLYDQFVDILNSARSNIMREAVSQAIIYGFSASVFFFMFAACFRFGLWLIIQKYVTPEHVLNVLFAISFTTGSLGLFSGYFPEYMKATVAAGKIFAMLREEPLIDGMSEHGQKPLIKGEVEVRNLRFSYPQRPNIPILCGIDLKVRKGETLALVGASGCGKSTIIGLLERHYNASGGSIEIDGVNVESLNTKHIRSHIALVSQEPVLFDRSIRENIAYGLETDVSQHTIEEACKKANIHSFISSLPQGYDTRVGEKGAQLSGGQKQRIAIARALVREPAILLLDEATSALDSESEKIVQEALDLAATGRTCIVVAHRLSTIQNADCIIVFKNGNIIERGTHTELLLKKGLYYELALKQSAAKTQ